MKKMILPVLLIVTTVTGCGRRERAPEEYINADGLVVFTSTTEDPAKLTPLFTETTTAPAVKRLSYSFTGTKMDLMLDDKVVKTLQLSYTEAAPPEDSDVVIKDFDLDGYYDVFVFYSGHTENRGEYYTYDPEKENFTENKALNEIGRLLEPGPDNTMIEKYTLGYIDRTVEYNWEGGKLKAFRKTEEYADSYDPEKKHKDIYSYDKNGDPVLESSN